LTADYYNNGFLIADARDAFVLETVGREWLVERVQTVRSLSNVYSIGADVERTSAGLTPMLQREGWSTEPPKDYASVITNPHREHIGQACARRGRSTELLSSCEGHLRIADMKRILRDHGPAGLTGAAWNPQNASVYTLCMHAGDKDHPGQTTSTLVSEIRAKDSVHWVTGTAAPCTSVFKPVLMDVALPAHGTRPTGLFDVSSLWWRHEQLHRVAVLTDLDQFLRRIHKERDVLEASFRDRVSAVLNGGNTEERSRVIADCWQEALETENRWLETMGTPTVFGETPFHLGWLEMSREAGLELSSHLRTSV
jgi:dipeptidase